MSEIVVATFFNGTDKVLVWLFLYDSKLSSTIYVSCFFFLFFHGLVYLKLAKHLAGTCGNI